MYSILDMIDYRYSVFLNKYFLVFSKFREILENVPIFGVSVFSEPLYEYTDIPGQEF